MRNLLLILCIGYIPIFNGCIKPKNNFPDPTAEPPYLEARNSVILQNFGGLVEIDISTNDENWSASVDESWVTLEIVSGTPGKLKITLPANNIMDERLANVKVVANNGSLEKIVRVIQYGTEKKISFDLGTAKTIDATANSFGLSIITNCPTFDINVSYEGTQTDWLTYTAPEIPRNGFEIQTLTYQFQATQNSDLDNSRIAKVKVIGTGLAEGVAAEFTVTQSANIPPPAQLTASLNNYDGVVATSMENLFDKSYNTFGETGYGNGDGAEKRTLDINVNADILAQIKFYPRNYSSPTALGSVGQYLTDFELWIQKTNATEWEKVKNVEVRGQGNVSTNKKYGNLTASQVPYLMYDGVLRDIQKVRFIITSGNSATGDNNQFWNASEIEFWGTPSTIQP